MVGGSWVHLRLERLDFPLTFQRSIWFVSLLPSVFFSLCFLVVSRCIWI